MVDYQQENIFLKFLCNFYKKTIQDITFVNSKSNYFYMSLLYLLGIKIFYFLVFIASFFNKKAQLWINGRKNWRCGLKSLVAHNEKIIWFHCASLGEFEQGRPLIEYFKTNYPDFKILLSFFSPSGYEIRKNYENADFIIYLPLDTPGNAKFFLDNMKPQMIFFIKYEFWYFFIREIGKRKIPLYLVSGIFREKQRFFKKYGKKSRKMLRFFTHFFVQNQVSKNLLNQIGLNNVTITGDTRFDRVYSIATNSKDLPLIVKFRNNNLVLVAGSTWPPDEDLLIQYMNKNKGRLKLIIAPHEIHTQHVESIERKINPDIKTLRYSEANESNVEATDILIIDAIGFLSSIYKYGHMAYIGGGFGKGIHNTLEAATFGLPVLFGPNYHKFQEAISLVELGGARVINGYSQLADVLDGFVKNSNLIKEAGLIAKNYVEEKRGATQRIIDQISIKKQQS